MYRKIVTELAYSPSLAANLSHYIKGLRNETSKRQIGLIFTLLAVILQFTALAFPPESTNTAQPSVFIDESFQAIEQYLPLYDQNAGHQRDLLNSLGISRADIGAMEASYLPSSTKGVTWSSKSPRSPTTGVHFFTSAQEEPRAAYYQALPDDFEGVKAFVGSSPSLGWFAITARGATLLSETSPASECERWQPGKAEPIIVSSWMKAKSCSALIDTSLTARIIPANSSLPKQLKPLDRVAYTISIANSTQSEISITPSLYLEDILEYSRVLDYGGSDYSFDTKNTSWETVTIPPGSRTERTVIVQLLPTIPATARGEYIRSSYDCSMQASFGTSVSSDVTCPFSKRIEQITDALPQTDRWIGTAFAAILLSTATFLYLRSRQLLSEIYIIRHNHLGGL